MMVYAVISIVVLILLIVTLQLKYYFLHVRCDELMKERAELNLQIQKMRISIYNLEQTLEEKHEI